MKQYLVTCDPCSEGSVTRKFIVEASDDPKYQPPTCRHGHQMTVVRAMENQAIPTLTNEPAGSGSLTAA